MEIHALLSLETSRQQVYQCLAECWHIPEKPMEPVLEKLLNHLTELDSKAVPAVGRLKTHAARTESPASLAPEFTRLFIGPFHPPCPPYGSVYIEQKGTLMENSTMDALKRYQDLGVDLDQNFNEAPDHICAELEFMCLLVYKELAGMRSDDPDQVEQLLAHQWSFLNDHLNQWIPLFKDLVMEHAESRFYQDLARITRMFLGEDHHYLTTIAASADQYGQIAQGIQE